MQPSNLYCAFLFFSTAFSAFQSESPEHQQEPSLPRELLQKIVDYVDASESSDVLACLARVSKDFYRASRIHQMQENSTPGLARTIKADQAHVGYVTLKLIQKLHHMSSLFHQSSPKACFSASSKEDIKSRLRDACLDCSGILRSLASDFRKIPDAPDGTVYSCSHVSGSDFGTSRRLMSSVFVNYLLFTDDSTFSSDLLHEMMYMGLELPGPKPYKYSGPTSSKEECVESFFRKFDVDYGNVFSRYASREYLEEYVAELRKYVGGDFTGLEEFASKLNKNTNDTRYIYISFHAFANLFQIPEVIAALKFS